MKLDFTVICAGHYGNWHGPLRLPLELYNLPDKDDEAWVGERYSWLVFFAELGILAGPPPRRRRLLFIQPRLLPSHATVLDAVRRHLLHDRLPA